MPTSLEDSGYLEDLLINILQINFMKLESYILATAKEPGKEDVDFSDTDKVTPYLSVRAINWYDVIKYNCKNFQRNKKKT